MLKIAFFLKRRPELTRPDFFAWWLDEHRSLVEKLPGLRRYVISLEAAGEDGSLDGLAELWFDDLAAAEAAFASAEAHVLDDVMAELRPFLDALGDGGGGHAGA